MIWRMTALAEMVRVPKDAVVIMKMLVWVSRQTVRRNRLPLTRAMRSISPTRTRLGSGAGRGGRESRMATSPVMVANRQASTDAAATPGTPQPNRLTKSKSSSMLTALPPICMSREALMRACPMSQPSMA